MKRTLHALERAFATDDIAGIEEHGRAVIRHGDRNPVVERLLAWLLDRWRARPLPRLAELISHLGPLVSSPAVVEARASRELGMSRPVVEQVVFAGEEW